MKLLCDSLRGSKSLKRFSSTSNRLTNHVSQYVVDFALSCKSLISLNLGYYKSTYHLGEKPNFFTDISPFKYLVENHKSLMFLDLQKNNIDEKKIIELIELVKEMKLNMTIYGSQMFKSKKGKKLLKNVHSIQKLQDIRNPKRVTYIDSIYRNRM